MGQNHYETLGVEKDATKDELKKAYRKGAQTAHPDKGGSDAAFKKLKAAYNTLRDDTLRARYDAAGCDEETTHDRWVREVLENCILGTLDLIRRGRYVREDLLTACADNLMESIKLETSSMLEPFRAERSRLEEDRKRIGSKKANVFEDVLTQEIHRVDAEIQAAETSIRIQQDALDKLNDHNYRHDEGIEWDRVADAPRLPRSRGRWDF